MFLFDLLRDVVHHVTLLFFTLYDKLFFYNFRSKDILYHYSLLNTNIFNLVHIKSKNK